MKYTPRTKPFPHQAKATLKAVKNRNFAVFFEPRLGKTKVAADYSGILAMKGEVRRVVVFAPSIALGVWRRELRKHFPFPYTVEDFDYTYPTPKRGDGPQVQFFLAGREETFRAVRASTNLKRPKQREIERWNPDAVIIDESHQYKRPGGRAAQDAWRLVRRLRSRGRRDGRPYVLLLSGTPNPKGWRDLFAQFRIMDERLLGTNAGEFDDEYVVRGEGRRRWTIIRYRHVARLRRTIRENSITCTAKQAGLEGKLFWQVLPVTLPQKARQIYNELADELIVQTAHGTIDAANQGVLRLRLLQVTSGFAGDLDEHGNRPTLHHAKVDSLRAYAQNLFEQGESLVVYSRFTAEVDAAKQVLDHIGYPTQVLDGRTKRRDRDHVIQRFQDSQCAALAIQYQAGNVSIELTAAAEVLFTSLPDSWVDFWQCLNRLRGPNQHRPVRVTALVATGTVDRKVLASLRKKEDWHGELMRDPTRYLRGL